MLMAEFYYKLSLDEHFNFNCEDLNFSKN